MSVAEVFFRSIDAMGCSRVGRNACCRLFATLVFSPKSEESARTT